MKYGQRILIFIVVAVVMEFGRIMFVDATVQAVVISETGAYTTRYKSTPRRDFRFKFSNGRTVDESRYAIDCPNLHIGDTLSITVPEVSTRETTAYEEIVAALFLAVCFVGICLLLKWAFT